MKKNFAVLLAISSLFCLSCSGSGSDDLLSLSQGGKYSVGDVILKDGTVAKYRENREFTDSEKANAIAVIFYSGSDFGALGKCSLGIGLKKSETKLLWCSSNASAAEKRIPAVECNIIGDGVKVGREEYTFSFFGDIDGSDNLEQISLSLKSMNLYDDTYDKTKYPAFYFAKNYSNVEPKLKGTSFENGWYLPTIAELYQFSKNKTKVYASINKLGVKKLNSQWEDWLVTSSQGAYKPNCFSGLRVSDCMCSDRGVKYSDSSAVKACAVRRFD